MVMKVGVDMDNYYPRLRDLREDHDMSQQDVADYLHMKQPQYSRYERGLRDVLRTISWVCPIIQNHTIDNAAYSD